MMVNDLSKMKINTAIPKKYYVTYLRKSSESEDRQIQSIDDQRRAIAPLLEGKNLRKLESFEESRSAKAPGRSEFNRMIDLINAREDIKGIVCWKLNRLSRNPVDTGTLQWLLQNGKIEEIVTPSKTYTEGDSDFIMAVEGAQANRFIRDLREDTQRGLNSKVEKGMAPVLAVPGYKNDTAKKQGERDIIVDQVQFPLMRKLFDLALTGNYSVAKLFTTAKEMGIKTGRGKPISHSRMAELLHNPFYTGKFVYDGQLYNGIHKQMLSPQEFELLQEIFTDPSRPRPSRHEHPLPRLVTCTCSRSLVFEPKVKRYKNGKMQTFAYLRCNRPRHNPSPNCSKSSIALKDLNEQIIEQLGTIKISPKLVEWGIMRLNIKNEEKQKAREAECQAIKESYDGIVKKLDSLLQLKLSPLNSNGEMLPDAEYIEQRTKLITERDEVYSKFNSLDTNREEWAKLAVSVFNFAARAQERYQSGDLETRRDICRIFGTSLVLNGKKLKVQPRTPFVYIQDALQNIEPNEVAIDQSNVALYASEPSIGVADGNRTRNLCCHRAALCH